MEKSIARIEPTWFGRTAGAFVALALASITSQAHAASAHKAGEVVMETASAKTAGGETVRFEIGTLYVPENRAVPGSRVIGIGFARIRAAQPTGAPPIFDMAGGPGSSNLRAFVDGDPYGQDLLQLFVRLSAAGDVVVFDQRGYSKRGEVLEFAWPQQPLDRPGSPSADAANMVKAAREAIAAHPDKDLAGYTIVQCAEDVNDLRRALGYDKITLFAESFGSQWAFAVMRLHPEIVARAQLAAVEPLDFGYDMPSHVLAALQRIAFDADRDPGLAPYLPKGGIMTALRAVRDRFARAPIKVKVKDEMTGRVQEVVLGVKELRDSLVVPAHVWPAFVLSLYHGHYDDWARALVKQNKDNQFPLIGPLIDTSLGVTTAREHLLRTDPGGDLLGMGALDAYTASAPVWPSPDVGDDLRVPVLSSTPVLFIHGDWDTSTPVENTLSMLPYFPNSRTILVHRGRHGARYALLDQQPAARAAIIEFLKTGDTRAVPTHVTLPAPPFRRPAFPAPEKPSGP
ncbi:alpha/beta hydrolase [Myxococcus llanfairpwllgwyngyllgogerychwyrndrobwllllantysiliogogogochensis]|uniref:Alpha/beta hydrolase n=1 Tax=Myxococcus llanfairpwllgwyngyllgogerychwyrndrobwllllantysiliogogogochensis TaxID=2590453 RepID=A0A540X7Q1_9BACT|nr:alpha/beta hydrolase [Myxococcus llanfairpwllgwyngyllgogerychwyrndrobwllllantysiliogogogochensis]TQF17250.1 alpha/beta hydrolase [Myxococcus llanfairpwllgwyngyllgogerychwyrndrobwllllantysiliogogogochensis]